MSLMGNGTTGTGGFYGMEDEDDAKAEEPESINEWRDTKVKRKRKASFVNFNSPDPLYFVCRDDGVG